MQFSCFCNTIVISILPEAKSRENRIPAVDLAITVSSIYRLVILCECKKSIPVLRKWLRSNITEHLRSIIYPAIAIPVEYQKCVVFIPGCPPDSQSLSIAK